MTRQNDGLSAAIYTRISRDKEGTELGVQRQRKDLHTLAEERGYIVVASFEDNDISASTRSVKRRPQYEDLLRRAKTGEFRVILAYTSSRLTRRPRENEDLIELAERYKVRIEYVRSPSFDLNTADGRNIARILAANDAAESERIAERVSAAVAQRARLGGIHGGWAAFGYEPVKEMVLGRERVVAWAEHPQHADWLRDAAKRILDGETLYGICADWRRQGRLTGKGGTWSPRTLKRALLNPAVIGRRALHQGRDREFVGEFPAAWDPILDKKTQDRVRRTIERRAEAAPKNFEKGNGRRKYLLSGLVRCAACGATMASQTASKAGPVGFVHPPLLASQVDKHPGAKSESRRIAMNDLEDWVVTAFLLELDSPKLRATLSKPATQDTADLEAALVLAIEEDRQRLETLEDRLVDGLLDDKAFARQKARVQARLEENDTRLAAIEGRALPNLDPKSVVKTWSSMDVERQRTVLGHFIDRIEIDRYPAGMTTNLSRRRGESDEDLAERRAQHLAEVLERRVNIVWKI